MGWVEFAWVLGFSICCGLEAKSISNLHVFCSNEG